MRCSASHASPEAAPWSVDSSVWQALSTSQTTFTSEAADVEFTELGAIFPCW